MTSICIQKVSKLPLKVSGGKNWSVTILFSFTIEDKGDWLKNILSTADHDWSHFVHQFPTPLPSWLQRQKNRSQWINFCLSSTAWDLSTWVFLLFLVLLDLFYCVVNAKPQRNEWDPLMNLFFYPPKKPLIFYKNISQKWTKNFNNFSKKFRK